MVKCRLKALTDIFKKQYKNLEDKDEISRNDIQECQVKYKFV